MSDVNKGKNIDIKIDFFKEEMSNKWIKILKETHDMESRNDAFVKFKAEMVDKLMKILEEEEDVESLARKRQLFKNILDLFCPTKLDKKNLDDKDGNK